MVCNTSGLLPQELLNQLLHNPGLRPNPGSYLEAGVLLSQSFLWVQKGI